MMQQLGDIDQLENLLRGATNPGALAEADIDRVRDLLGDDAARSLDRLAELAKMLEQAGLIENKEGRYELTPKGIRRIGSNALNDLFTQAGQGQDGPAPARPPRHRPRAHLRDRSPTSSATRSTSTSTARSATPSAARGGGTPVRLAPDDFEIERTENLTKSSTVLMLDLSLSMPMRDNFLAAKKVAMALHSLISSMFPRDYLGIVGFSEVARELKAEQLPEVSWDFVYGTNMQHGFLLSRRMLARQTGTKQIIMITDGEPTAHIDPTARCSSATRRCPRRSRRRCGRSPAAPATDIRINTFMLDANSYLKAFVEKLTQMNRGRAFFTTPETLGDYVLVDFIEQKKAMRSGRRGA